MRKKTMIKLILDLVMILLLVLMYKKNALGLGFHEIGGLILLGIFIIHVFLNRNWVAGITKKFFSRKLPVRTRLSYILNFLIAIAFLVTGISGIFISKIVFNFSFNFGNNWQSIHIGAASIGLLLIGLHIGLHYEYIKKFLGSRIHLPKPLALGIEIFLLVFFVAFGSYNFIQTNFLSMLERPFISSSGQYGNRDMENLDSDSFPNMEDAPNMENQPNLDQQEDRSLPDSLPDTDLAPEHTSMTDDSAVANNTPDNFNRENGSGSENSPNADSGMAPGNNQGNFSPGNGSRDGFGSENNSDFSFGNENGSGNNSSISIKTALSTLFQYITIAMLFAYIVIILEKIICFIRKEKECPTDDALLVENSSALEESSFSDEESSTEEILSKEEVLTTEELSAPGKDFSEISSTTEAKGLNETASSDMIEKNGSKNKDYEL